MLLRNDKLIRETLASAKTIAVVGAVDKPGRPVDRVGRYLVAAGYTVIPVHPKRKDVWGLATYETLADIPVPIDVVDLFRAAQYCPDHAKECLALPRRPLLFWMQSGIVCREAAALLSAEGVLVVQDACLMVDHARLLGLSIPPQYLEDKETL